MVKFEGFYLVEPNGFSGLGSNSLGGATGKKGSSLSPVEW